MEKKLYAKFVVKQTGEREKVYDDSDEAYSPYYYIWWYESDWTITAEIYYDDELVFEQSVTANILTQLTQEDKDEYGDSEIMAYYDDYHNRGWFERDFKELDFDRIVELISPFDAKNEFDKKYLIDCFYDDFSMIIDYGDGFYEETVVSEIRSTESGELDMVASLYDEKGNKIA